MVQNGMDNHDETTLQGNMKKRERRNATPANVIRIICLIRTIAICTNVCFPIDSDNLDTWIIHTFCLIRTIFSRIVVHMIWAWLYISCVYHSVDLVFAQCNSFDVIFPIKMSFLHNAVFVPTWQLLVWHAINVLHWPLTSQGTATGYSIRNVIFSKKTSRQMNYIILCNEWVIPSLII